MKSGFCECLQGRNCGPCKHKFAIAHHFGVSGASCLPQLDNQSRARKHFIATGQEVDPSWFRGLRDTETQQPAPEPTQEPEQTSDLEETQNENEMDVVVNQDANDLDDDAQNHENRNDDDMNVDWDNDHANFKNINEQFMAAARQGYEAKDKGFIRAIRNFYKRLKNRLSNRQTLTHNLVTFGQETDDCVVPGRKRKNTEKIGVQPSAIERRKNKHGGKGPSTNGRRPNKMPSTSQSFVLEAEEQVLFNLNH